MDIKLRLLRAPIEPKLLLSSSEPESQWSPELPVLRSLPGVELARVEVGVLVGHGREVALQDLHVDDAACRG